MEDESNRCAICMRPISKGTGLVPFYFCADDYKLWKKDIEENAPWVKYFLNLEKQRRKQRNKRLQLAKRGY